jgi:hypothetical protein
MSHLTQTKIHDPHTITRINILSSSSLISEKMLKVPALIGKATFTNMERSTLRTRKIIVNFVPVDRRGILNNAALLELYSVLIETVPTMCGKLEWIVVNDAGQKNGRICALDKGAPTSIMQERHMVGCRHMDRRRHTYGHG